MHCPGGNATEPIWRALASSQGISFWTLLKPQHSIPCWLSVQWEPSACRSCQCCQKRDHQKFVGGFALSGLLGSGRSSLLPLGLSLKQNFIAYRCPKVSDCIFEIHQLRQSGFSRVYSNCSCSCSFGPEIIKIGQSSHKMYSNNIVNFQVSTTILNACTKKVWKLIEYTTYVLIVWLHENFLCLWCHL